jgi:hypothetical protein
MALYRDFSGKITIDEGEAKSDIRKIEGARGKLARARDLLNPDKIDSSVLRGNAREALDAQLSKICDELKRLESSCIDAANLITRTVTKYQRIDIEMRDRIMGR